MTADYLFIDECAHSQCIGFLQRSCLWPSCRVVHSNNYITISFFSYNQKSLSSVIQETNNLQNLLIFLFFILTTCLFFQLYVDLINISSYPYLYSNLINIFDAQIVCTSPLQMIILNFEFKNVLIFDFGLFC